MAGRLALHWPKALAPRGDSRAHREATDSSSVWEAPASPGRLVAGPRASLSRALETLDGAALRALARAVSPQQAMAFALAQPMAVQEEQPAGPEELRGVQLAWQRLGSALE